MRLEPLYRLRFDYPEGWDVIIVGENPSTVDYNPTTTFGTRGEENYLLLFAKGTVSGKISGRFRGANAPRVRTNGPAVMDFRGAIETDDVAENLFECHGFGRAYRDPYRSQSPELRQWVACVTHLSI